jgi:hypothetical protein
MILANSSSMYKNFVVSSTLKSFGIIMFDALVVADVNAATMKLIELSIEHMRTRLFSVSDEHNELVF